MPLLPSEARRTDARERTVLESALLATLAYHDLLDLPLTAVQAWRYLLAPRGSRQWASPHPPQLRRCWRERCWRAVGSRGPSLRDVEMVLGELTAARRIETRNGFYFFSGRAQLFEEWIEKHARSQRKWKRLRRIAVWLRAVPFLRGLAGTGSLAFDNAGPSSDLDVLVIAAPNRMWTVRFLLTIILDALRLRRRPRGPTADRVCLNHYLSEDALAFPYRSLYTALEYARLVPLLGEEACRRFRAANRAWMEEYLVRVFPDSLTHVKTVPDIAILRALQQVGEWCFKGRLGDALERRLARLQQARIARAEVTAAPAGRIVATEVRAEFHPHSREAPLLRSFNARMAELGLAREFGWQRDSGLTVEE